MTNWKIKSPDPQLVANLQKEFKAPEIIATVLANHNIYSVEQSREFFSPEISMLHDPFLIPDMEKGAKYVAKLVSSNKKILVFGDYDVDGITGASMLYLFLKSLGADVEVYIPNREKDGYGLSKTGVDYSADIGAELIITCDCGINAFESVNYANERNIKVIITDHHTTDTKLPDAYAILNPKIEGCKYPFRDLCGGGVTFKLASAVAIILKVDPDLVLKHIDLITLGTAADIVPLVDENRIIVYNGLRLLGDSDKPGIRALLKVSGLSDKELTVGRLVFWIAPRINAAGRMGDPSRAIKLLTTDNFSEAVQLANQLDQENRNRQEIQKTIVDEALRKVNAEIDLQRNRAIVLWKDGWHPGVIGIVASKIREEYSRPTVIISLDGDTGKGSARSIPGFDLYENLTQCAHYLDDYGGHPMAAGLSVSEDNLHDFRSKFVSQANTLLSDDDLVNTISIEGEMSLSIINSRFMEFLDKLAPYGPGNMRPIFLTKKISVSGTPKLVGAGSDHLRFTAKQNGTSYDCIGFNLAKHYEHLITGEPVDIVYVVEENEWQGQRSIQLNIRDIKPSSEVIQ
ncbi:MAG: single-stranded-DNA-specific exonuclease RecJ [Candidatus Marinimicrobia bacterium]|nr:single-stranded-DNA-specific exonuclease RecJ [Candidatus Neomarinimicrobiota bacterium]MBL7047032.1 single-stranded-DNA-specific exonuclease RecJ [Candidatus Neomarinimicrobiota bacterium]